MCLLVQNFKHWSWHSLWETQSNRIEIHHYHWKLKLVWHCYFHRRCRQKPKSKPRNGWSHFTGRRFSVSTLAMELKKMVSTLRSSKQKTSPGNQIFYSTYTLFLSTNFVCQPWFLRPTLHTINFQICYAKGPRLMLRYHKHTCSTI